MMTPAPLMTGRSVGDSDARSRGSSRSSIRRAQVAGSPTSIDPAARPARRESVSSLSARTDRVVSVLRLETAHAITLAQVFDRGDDAVGTHQAA